MGFHYAVEDFNTVEEIAEAFRVSEANQFWAMLKFIKSKPLMASALEKRIGRPGLLLQRHALRAIQIR